MNCFLEATITTYIVRHFSSVFFFIFYYYYLFCFVFVFAIFLLLLFIFLLFCVCLLCPRGDALLYFSFLSFPWFVCFCLLLFRTFCCLFFLDADDCNQMFLTSSQFPSISRCLLILTSNSCALSGCCHGKTELMAASV